MLLLKEIKVVLEVISPFMIHFIMVVFFALYTVFGALCIQQIENTKLSTYNQSLERIKRSNNEPVLSQAELVSLAPKLRPCVEQALREMLDLGKCDLDKLKTLSISTIDDCYRFSKIKLSRSRKAVVAKDHHRFPVKNAHHGEDFVWDFHNSIVFAFTLLTTIGYGNIAPITRMGRLFSVVYSLIGIPLALLTIADVGMFLSKCVHSFAQHLSNACFKMLKWRKYKRFNSCKIASSSVDLTEVKPSRNKLSSSSQISAKFLQTKRTDQLAERCSAESIMLAIIFVLYLFLGSLIISLYEPDMNFFTAFYFNFVSLTTIGLGDFVPKNSHFTVVTFVYLSVGLALTTIVVEIAADFLKHIHYFGRKFENVASTDIWFGGRKMKFKNLIKHLGDQLNIPIEEMQKFDVESFAEDTVRVASGELKSLKAVGASQAQADQLCLENADPARYKRSQTGDRSRVELTEDGLVASTGDRSMLQTAQY